MLVPPTALLVAQGQSLAALVLMPHSIRAIIYRNASCGPIFMRACRVIAPNVGRRLVKHAWDWGVVNIWRNGLRWHRASPHPVPFCYCARASAGLFLIIAPEPVKQPPYAAPADESWAQARVLVRASPYGSHSCVVDSPKTPCSC